MALCAILSVLAPVYGYHLRAHHVQHGLRDDAADLCLAHKIAATLGVDFVHTKLELNPGAPNVEARARAARYDALHAAAKNGGAYYIALGHHGDENVETMVWRLTRGCGIEGLCLRAQRRHGEFLHIRPLLIVDKDEIYSFLQHSGLPWIEDPTNLSQDYTRNRIRHRVLATLNHLEINKRPLFRSLNNLAHDAQTVEQLSEFVALHCVWHGPICLIPHSIHNDFGFAAFCSVFRHVTRHIIAQYQPSHDFVQRVLALYNTKSKTQHKASDNYIVVEFDKSFLTLYPVQHELENRGIVYIETKELMSFPPLTREIPPYGKVQLMVLEASHWQKPTDTWFAVDMPDDGKLSIESASLHPKFYADNHELDTRDALRAMAIPRVLRNNYPILCLNHEPLCIIGGARSALGRRKGNAERCVAIHWLSFLKRKD